MSPSLVAFLAVTFICLLVSVTVTFLVLCEPGLKFKALWAVLSLAGMGGGAMVWSMPSQVHWFFGVSLPTASFVAVEDGWEPALVRFLLPVGALMASMRLYWHRRGNAKGPISA